MSRGLTIIFLALASWLLLLGLIGLAMRVW